MRFCLFSEIKIVSSRTSSVFLVAFVLDECHVLLLLAQFDIFKYYSENSKAGL